MTRRASHLLSTMRPGAQSSEITGFALPRLGAGRSAVLSLQSALRDLL